MLQGDSFPRWMKRAVSPICLALLLGGCAADAVQLTGLWEPEAAATPAAPAAPLYCYRNLARVDCYTGPDPQRRH